MADSLTYTKLRPDLVSEPMIGADEDFFVDGSCFRDHLGNHAGFAVVRLNPDDTFAVVRSSQCAQPCSAQLAELRALRAACQEGAGKSVMTTQTLHMHTAYVICSGQYGK